MIILPSELKIKIGRRKKCLFLTMGMINLDINKTRTELASYIGKLLRDYYGKGPESVYVSINETAITIYLRQFISPMEKALIMQNKEDVVQETRDILMTSLIPEMKATIKIMTGMEIEEFYFDWGMDNFSGIMTGITSDKSSLTHLTEMNFPGKAELHEEINVISNHAEKVPAETLSFQLNERTVVVIRNGILVNIERELIRMGQRELLRLAKRRLEKRLLHNNNRFDSILNSEVIDIFVDWNFDHDRSVIVFILNPKN